MIMETYTVAAPASVAAGAATDVSKINPFTVTLAAVGVGTYQLQIADTANQWMNEGAALTASGNIAVTKPCTQIRWNCTAFTSGAPTSSVCGVASTGNNW